MNMTLGIASNIVSSSSIGDDGMYGSSNVYREVLDAEMAFPDPERKK